MALTSLPFAIFAIITGILYFVYPKKEQRWVILLIASCFFICTTVSGMQLSSL